MGRRPTAGIPLYARRFYAYAACTEAEYAIVRAAARKEDLNVSDFVRRCVNSYLLEVTGDDVPLLAELRSKDRCATS